jgi:arylsulfatase A-like enzyme
MKCIVLSVHGLRPDCLGCYGNDWIDTPNLDRLASESVVFDQHLVGSPDLIGAHRVWRTGDTDLLQCLSAAGVETRLLGDSAYPPPDFMTEGFQKSRFVKGGPAPGARVEGVFHAALRAAAQAARRERVLLWIDLPSLLPPWQVRADFLDLYFPSEPEAGEDESETVRDDAPLVSWSEALPPVVAGDDEETLLRLRRTYAAVVSHFDAQLRPFLESLEENDAATPWLVAVTAPFGLPLGDHGIAGMHRPWLHNELIHVPLVIRLPGAAEAGRRVLGLTQTIDLPVTLLEAFGVRIPTTTGRSLLSLCRGEVEMDRTEAISTVRATDAEEWAIHTSCWAFLLPVTVPPDDPHRGPQLYVKPEDRFEVNNVAQHHVEVVEELERTLREKMKG